MFVLICDNALNFSTCCNGKRVLLGRQSINKCVFSAYGQLFHVNTATQPNQQLAQLYDVSALYIYIYNIYKYTIYLCIYNIPVCQVLLFNYSTDINIKNIPTLNTRNTSNKTGFLVTDNLFINFIHQLKILSTSNKLIKK